jgi:hypothetical protein
VMDQLSMAVPAAERELPLLSMVYRSTAGSLISLFSHLYRIQLYLSGVCPVGDRSENVLALLL